MKKLYVLLLSFNLFLGGGSVFAKGGNQDSLASIEEIAAGAAATVDKSSLSEALQKMYKENKELRGKLKKVFKKLSSQENAVYEKRMQEITLKIHDGMNKLLNPTEKKELSFLMDILSGSLDIVKGTTKTVAKYALAGTVLTLLAAVVAYNAPYAVATGAQYLGQYVLSGWQQAVSTGAIPTVVNATGVLGSNCPGYMTWLVTLGNCA